MLGFFIMRMCPGYDQCLAPLHALRVISALLLVVPSDHYRKPRRQYNNGLNIRRLIVGSHY